ncbi:MAG: hypothetical protein J3K34DRAFT_96363 [Monoraphidium minutum]|nr:MAG: hypothetical protein J3K34DRAFT_96363 [Monoraphidium minutum]
MPASAPGRAGGQPAAGRAPARRPRGGSVVVGRVPRGVAQGAALHAAQQPQLEGLPLLPPRWAHALAACVPRLTTALHATPTRCQVIGFAALGHVCRAACMRGPSRRAAQRCCIRAAPLVAWSRAADGLESNQTLSCTTPRRNTPCQRCILSPPARQPAGLRLGVLWMASFLQVPIGLPAVP